MRRLVTTRVFLLGFGASVAALLVCAAHMLSPTIRHYALVNASNAGIYLHMPTSFVIAETVFYLLNIPVALVVLALHSLLATFAPAAQLIATDMLYAALSFAWWLVIARLRLGRRANHTAGVPDALP